MIEHLNQLRDRALQALSAGNLQLQDLTPLQQRNVDEVLEELRIYQAELEIQNHSLLAMQADLQVSQHLYQTLFESLPVAAMVLDNRGVIQQVNQQAMVLLALPKRKHFINHSVYRYFPQQGATWLAQVLTRARVSLMGEQLDVFTAEGTQAVAAYVVKLPQHPDAIDETRFILLLADLSVEIAKKEQWQLFESIINNSPTLIYAFDRDDKCILANQKAYDYLMPGEMNPMIGLPRSTLFSAEDSAAHFEYDGLIYNTEHPISYEESIQRNGKTLHLLSHKFPLTNLQGDIYAVAGISTDITLQRESEMRLKIALQVFSQGQEGIIICDSNNQILSVNHAFEKITGHTEAQVIGKNPRLLGSGKHSLAFYQAMWQSVLDTGIWQGEIWNRRKNGDTYPQFLTISVVYDHQHQPSHYLGVFSDITARKLAEEEVQQLAFYDSLTGTANRFLLRERIEQTLRQAVRLPETAFSVLFIDLDHFKEVNDVFGHDAGDALLKQVTERIQKHIREQDTLSRFGGDEFVLFLNGITPNQAIEKAKSLIAELLTNYWINEQQLNISASIGVVHYPLHGQDYETLLKHADVAMYQAKHQGRNAFALFDYWMTQSSQEFMSIDVALRQAIENQQLRLAFQPQINAQTQQWVGVEALLRWQHPVLGDVSPSVFIPVAEKSDLIKDLTNWVLKESLQALQTLTAIKLGVNTRICVNISARELMQDDFVQRIQAQFEQFPGVAPYRLELELTERIAIQDAQKVSNVLHSLKAIGVRLALDDFGVGFSSLSILKILPLDVLKIDMSFACGVVSHPQDAAVCNAIIAMANALGLQTVAEGVETQAQAQFFSQNGATLLQGYLFAKPMFFDALVTCLNELNAPSQLILLDSN
jgi:two-component system CheB/CheR fusion protein